MTVGEARRCPPSEVLAAFVDAKLPRAQVVRLTEHLADCAECRVIVEDAAEAAGEDVSAGVAEPPRKRTWQWISIAAAIAAAVLMTPMLQTRWAIRQRDVAMRELIATDPGPQRMIEPRVSGGFRFAPKSTNRGVEKEVPLQQMIFEDRAHDVLDRARNDRTPAGAHARGIADLMLKDSAKAVRELTDLTTRHPNDAAGWSDLSAALFVAGDPQGARAAAERAVELDPNLKEAWFNRALAANTIPAWNDYLRHDPTGPWADEARSKIDRLSDEK